MDKPSISLNFSTKSPVSVDSSRLNPRFSTKPALLMDKPGMSLNFSTIANVQKKKKHKKREKSAGSHLIFVTFILQSYHISRTLNENTM